MSWVFPLDWYRDSWVTKKESDSCMGTSAHKLTWCCSIYRHQLELRTARNSITPHVKQKIGQLSFSFLCIFCFMRMCQGYVYLYFCLTGNIWSIVIKLTGWFHYANCVKITSHQLSSNGLAYIMRVLCNLDTVNSRSQWYTYIWEILLNYNPVAVLDHWYLMQWCAMRCISLKF